MPFEFDPGKSASNKVKHGIDFVSAQTLWKISVRKATPLEISAYAKTKR